MGFLRLIVRNGLCLLLVGCAFSPQKLGISEQEWLSYSDDQRQQIIADYKKISLDQQQENKRLFLGVGRITVSISGGEAMMPPFVDWSEYQPVSFDLADNICGEIPLQQKDGENTVNLRACYKNKALFLDPSRYDLEKNNGTVSIPQSPLWQQGFEYKGISTSGHVRLRNATVKINDS